LLGQITRGAGDEAQLAEAGSEVLDGEGMAVHKLKYRLPRYLRAAALALLAALAVVGRADAAEKHAVLVIDANTGQTVYQNSADALRHPASLTKMMTLYLVFEQIEQGRLGYQTKIKVSANAAAAAPSKLDLDEGDEIALIDAVKALITKSANDVAVAVAEHIGGTEAKFARLMTQKAAQLGMKATLFKNASGLPDAEQVTTARDMAILALRLQDDFPRHYPLFATRTFTFKDDTYRNHNNLLANYEGTDGLKTGYTQASGFNLVASVRRGQKHVIGVVFGGASASTRDRTMRTFLNVGLVKASHIKTRVPASAVVAARPKLAERKVAEVPTPERVVVRPPAKPVVSAAADEPPQAQTSTQPIEIARVRTVLVTPRPAAKAPDSIEAVLERPEPAKPEPPQQPQQQWATATTGGSLLRAPATTPTDTAKRVTQPSTLEQQAARLGGGAARPDPSVTTQALNEAEGKPRWSAQVQAAAGTPGGFHVQIGAYQSVAEAERQLAAVREKAAAALRNRAPLTVQFKLGDKLFYRARYAGFDAQSAAAACGELKRLQVDCLVMKAE
jgi:D-alanyl-D-alanine carboxypeptidase